MRVPAAAREGPRLANGGRVIARRAAILVATLLFATADARAGQLVIRVPLPQVGVGVAVGQTRVDDATDGTTRAVSLRLRFGRYLELAGELGKATYDDASRTDLQVGGGAYLHLGGRGRLSPFVGGAAGAGTVERGGWYTADQAWGHLALGLSAALSPRVRLAGEVDIGRRKLRMTGESVLLRDAPVDLIYLPDQEHYRQLRLGLTLSF